MGNIKFDEVNYYNSVMTYNYNEDYQYDSCISRGLCSINPRTSSLQEVLVLYLKLTAYYTLKLYEIGIKDGKVKNLILNTISVMVSNSEFSESDFKILTKSFVMILPDLVKQFKDKLGDEDCVPKDLEKILKFDSDSNIVCAIQLGEKEFLKKNKNLNPNIRALYQIIFVLAKALCMDVSILSTYEIDSDKGYLAILTLLNSLNQDNQTKEELKSEIIYLAKTDNELMKQIKLAQKERYGNPVSSSVSCTTRSGKAILVVGSNLRELEDVLEAIKDEEIDVYTHDEMSLANTYPKFKEYKHLIGQFGQGMENCLLDFATFPGPIILTKYSLYNVETLYRGLLYTTDLATTKGVIPILNRNFEPVIEAAKRSKGFKTGKKCNNIELGINYEEILKTIIDRAKNFSRVFIIGIGAYNLEQKTYFEKLLVQAPKDTLIVSLSFCKDQENVICVNASFDFYAMSKLTEYIMQAIDKDITLFFPKCDRHTISQIVFLKEENKKINIYLGKCSPIMLNPNIITVFKNEFGIKNLKTVKKNLEEICDE